MNTCFEPVEPQKQSTKYKMKVKIKFYTYLPKIEMPVCKISNHVVIQK